MTAGTPNPLFFLTGIIITIFLYGCSTGICHRDVDVLSPAGEELAAIENAMNKLAIPPGNGREISFFVEKEDRASIILYALAADFFILNGYNISETGERIELKLERYLSSAEGSTPGFRIVLSGDIGNPGEDFTFDGTSKPCLASDIEVKPGKNFSLQNIKPGIKPLSIGVAITVFAWLLYSYRG